MEFLLPSSKGGFRTGWPDRTECRRAEGVFLMFSARRTAQAASSLRPRSRAELLVGHVLQRQLLNSLVADLRQDADTLGLRYSQSVRPTLPPSRLGGSDGTFPAAFPPPDGARSAGPKFPTVLCGLHVHCCIASNCQAFHGEYAGQLLTGHRHSSCARSGTVGEMGEVTTRSGTFSEQRWTLGWLKGVPLQH